MRRNQCPSSTLLHPLNTGKALNHAKTYSQTCKNGTRRGFGDDGHWSHVLNDAWHRPCGRLTGIGDSQVSEQTVLLDVQPNASDRLTMDISASNGTFEIDGSQPRLIDANGQVSRVFKTGVVTLPDGQEAEVTYTLVSDTKLEAHVRPTRGLDRDCFGDALNPWGYGLR